MKIQMKAEDLLSGLKNTYNNKDLNGEEDAKITLAILLCENFRQGIALGKKFDLHADKADAYLITIKIIFRYLEKIYQLPIAESQFLTIPAIISAVDEIHEEIENNGEETKNEKD